MRSRVDALSVMVVVAALGLGCDDPAPQKSEVPAEKPAAPAPKLEPPPAPQAEAAPEKVEKAEKKPVTCPPAPKVLFTDAALEKEVRRKASKPEGELTLADIKKVRSV